MIWDIFFKANMKRLANLARCRHWNSDHKIGYQSDDDFGVNWLNMYTTKYQIGFSNTVGIKKKKSSNRYDTMFDTVIGLFGGPFNFSFKWVWGQIKAQITLFEQSNFCPKIQFWQNPNIFTSFSHNFFFDNFSREIKVVNS